MDKKNKTLAKVFHIDLYGKREEKYNFLNENSVNSIDWKELDYKEPYFFFVPKDFEIRKNYDLGFYVKKLFSNYNSGIQTKCDELAIHFTELALDKVIDDFTTYSIQELKIKYSKEDSSGWTYNNAQKAIIENNFQKAKISFRPFDERNSIYCNYSGGFIGRPRERTMKHMFQKNIAILFPRQAITEKFGFFVTNKICDINYTGSAGQYGAGLVFPLYLYPDKETEGVFAKEGLSEKGRKPNLNPEIVQKIANKLGLKFVAEKNSPPPQGEVVNSPPPEGCPQGGVVKPSISINKTPIKRNFVKNLPHNPKLNQLAKDKRKAGILSEVLFWKQVHKKKFHAIDFDRQRIIGNYIVDFYVKTLGLIIEIDGSSHDNKAEYDDARQEYLESLGLKVYRISDSDVKKNLNQAMLNLENYIVNEYGETTPPVGHPSKGMETTPPAGHPSGGGEFAPIDILDYIYAVLHSPTYREKYKEFLKIDFPRVPYPKNAKTFWQLVKLGGEIRQIHLLESPKVNEYITQYPEGGTNQITTKIAKKDWVLTNETTGRIYINETQYFENIPLVAWEFYIGGYQPAQKWLKDRTAKKGKEGRTLTYDDILHYQKIIVALTETDRIMKEIDGIEIE